MDAKIRGRIIAIVIIVITLYFIIDYSSLPESEVAKIRATVEESKQNNNTQASMNETAEQLKASSLLDEPPIIAYESFLTALPNISFISELDRFFIPGAEIPFRTRLEGMGSDLVEVAQGMHDFKGLKYLSLQYQDASMVQFTFLASNRMSRVIADDETSTPSLWEYNIVMERYYHAWLIKDFDINQTPTEQNLAKYEKLQ